MSPDGRSRHHGARGEPAVSFEKAFAMHAPPEAIFEALERELGEAESDAGGTFEVLRREPPRAIDLRVTIGGMSCWLTYELEPKQGHTEVTARLTPFGWRYLAFKIITLGLRNDGFEIPLVEGLANLKAAVEGGPRASAGDAPDEG
jgi:hypothetical protein